MIDLEWVLISEGPWGRRRKHQVVVCNDVLLILGGFDGEAAFDLNDVWSWDENSWQLVTEHAGWSGRDGHCAVVLNEHIFVIGGTDDPYCCRSDVWKSVDGGRSWIEVCNKAPFPERWQHASCIHNNKIFISGGWGGHYFNDIWSSSNGINWILVCANCPWKARMFHSLISFDNSLFVIGGHDARTQLRDVWCSRDEGITWTQVCQSTQWEGRQGHSTVVLDGSVYLMGGFGGSSRFNDLWKSDDCVEWRLLSRQCNWTPRQGHASIAYRGALCLLGGFDESGYCNSLYRLPITGNRNLTIVAADSSKAIIGCGVSRSDSQITMSSYSSPALRTDEIMDKISHLRVKRQEREEMIQLLVRIVSMVLAASTVPKLHPGEDINPTTEAEINTTASSNIIEEADSVINTKDKGPPLRLAPAYSLSDLNTIGDTFELGSPFRERMSEKGKLPEMILQTTISVSDFSLCHQMNSDTIRSRVSSCEMSRGRDNSCDSHSPSIFPLQSVEPVDNVGLYLDDNEANDATTNDKELESTSIDAADVLPLASTEVSSAKLRDSMNEDTKKIIGIQFQIKVEAERDDCEMMENRIIERTSAAKIAASHAELLIGHVDTICNLQEFRLKKVAAIHSQLENIVHSYPNLDISVDSDSDSSDTVESTLKDWEGLLLQCSLAINEGQIPNSESHISNFCANLRSQARICNQMSEWIESSPSTNSSSTSYKKLSYEYGNIMEFFSNNSLNTILSAIELEINFIASSRQRTVNLVKLTLEKGCLLVRDILSQSRIDLLEINSMKTEVQDWHIRATRLLEVEDLKMHCKSLIEDCSQREEHLLRLEDNRIDIKSILEKCNLKGHTRRRLSPPNLRIEDIGNSNMLPSPHSPRENENHAVQIDGLKERLATAEKAVKDCRREMRAWYRDTRQFALDFAPELFLYLPDLQRPGSILGDGGFAEQAKLPQRGLDEYENVQLLVNSSSDGNNFTKSTAGWHILYKAQFEGETVVLKGFIVHEVHQRDGLERELSILGRLKNDCIISPQAIVQGNSVFENHSHLAIFIQYPYYSGGNLSSWLNAQERKPWDLQSIERQLLYGLLYLHDHGVIHKDIKPSNVLLHEDGRIVLTDFELSKEALNEDVSLTIRSGSRGFMAPEIEAGRPSVFASDMYSYGILLYYIHFPNLFSTIVPGKVHIPANNDSELSDLITRLVDVDPSKRLSANTALMHPYFRVTFVERLMQDGEIVAQDRKLEAVRSMLDRTRASNRTNIETITISRNSVVQDVIRYFQNTPLNRIRANLKATFVGEAGVDEGGLLTEMFTMFYESIFQQANGLFETSDEMHARNDLSVSAKLSKVETNNSSNDTIMHMRAGVVLPRSSGKSIEQLLEFRAFGRALVKTLYEGKRIGSRLSPSVFKFIADTNPNMRDLQVFDPETARSLQWTLATIGVEEFDLNFESVDAPSLGAVTDSNKATFVSMKIDRVLVECRRSQLQAIKDGFTEAMKALSVEAAPFMSLLSHTDWRVLLCGETLISGPQVVSVLNFNGFPRSSQMPVWLREIILSSSDDHLRKFLVFVTGSPSLPSRHTKKIEIVVRCQPRSFALPVSHTCFFHLDIPDYKDKETCQTKLIYAFQNANTFDIV